MHLLSGCYDAEEDGKRLCINFTLVFFEIIISGDRETGWKAFVGKQVRDGDEDLAPGSDNAVRTQET